ncbi:MAG: PAS domain-containing protein [Lachnospiraceae bacterium]|jgi:PAS domain S-box-containing protein
MTGERNFERDCYGMPVSGFHILDLSSEKPFVRKVSRNLCEMTGYSEEFFTEQNGYDQLIVPADRGRYAAFLKTVQDTGEQKSEWYRIVCADGRVKYVNDTVVPVRTPDGGLAGCSSLSDITGLRENVSQPAEDSDQYLRALTEVYDKIFRFDQATDTVTCIYSGGSPLFSAFENVPMNTESASDRWIRNMVPPEDQARVTSYFMSMGRQSTHDAGKKPATITYSARSSDGQIKKYTGIFLKMTDNISLFCCRALSEEAQTEMLKKQNASLTETMHEILSRFTEGIAAFEITPGWGVKPLYVSENIWKYFGVSQEEWMELMEKETPMPEFVAKSHADISEFADLLTTGEHTFTYLDVNENRMRRLRAVCSQKSQGSTPRFVLLYNLDEKEEEKPAGPEQHPKVFIRTFGYFDVFVGEKPVAFHNRKAKELLALLTDRRGGFVTSEEAVGFLWEDEPVTSVTLARYRKAAMRLKNTLEAYGIGDIVEVSAGSRRLVPEKVRCDLYDYLSGNPRYASLFKGVYLQNYSWGEVTLAELTGKMLEI